MKKFFTVLAAFACAVSLTACGSSNDSSKTLIVGAEELTGTFSPMYYSSAYDGYVVDMVYNKLMEYDVNNTLQPALAEKAVVNEDGTEITFHLKKGVKFSDGTDFDAKDVDFSYKVVSDPSYSGRFGSTAAFLEGYSDYSQQELMSRVNPVKARVDAAKEEVKAAKKKKDKAKEEAATATQKEAQAELDVLQKELDSVEEPEYPGITVVDDNTIKFKFTEPRNDNLSTLMNISIISADQFKDTYKYKTTKPIEEAMKKPIGTGPYVLKEWQAGTGASFEKNKEYKGEGFAIESVIIKPVKMETDYQELEAGKIDLLAGMIEPKKVGPGSNNEDLVMNNYPRGGEGYISYNTVTGATADKAVRQAMTFAFDRQAFVDSYYECKDCKDLDGVKIGYAPTTFQNPISKLGPVIQGSEKVDGLETYDFNLDKAKAVLDEAGWVAGEDGVRVKDGQRFEIKILAIKDHDIINNLIPMWNKNWKEIGAEVKIATVDFNTLVSKVYSDAGLADWNVFFMANSWTSDSMTDIYTTFNSKYASENNDNLSRIQDPELDAMMDSAIKQMDPEKALEEWKQVSVKLNEDCATIGVYGNTYFDMYHKKVKNMKTNALYSWVKGLKDATIE